MSDVKREDEGDEKNSEVWRVSVPSISQKLFLSLENSKSKIQNPHTNEHS